jgi:hypothetical protein
MDCDQIAGKQQMNCKRLVAVFVLGRPARSAKVAQMKGSTTMNRWCLILLIAGLLTQPLLADEADPPGDKSAISISIAIPVHHGHRSLDLNDHFHVLVTNVSDKPLRLWTDQYSWGYENLSFEQILDDGTVIEIRKKAREWRKNFPDWLELQPGENYVLNVLLSPDVWDNAPIADQPNKPKLVKLRAIYKVPPDEQSDKLGVWTGKIVSPVGTYSIW